MSTSAEPIDCLGRFIDRVTAFRKWWGLANHKDIWFRGESRDYGETMLRPELYRPACGVSLKPTWKLLEIEKGLYDEFQRIAVERCDEKTSEEDWDWDSYFLMQHHDGPTRLLDWSDGALMALHFAVRNKKDDGEPARVYVLEPSRLVDKIDELADVKLAKETWKAYVGKHPSYRLEEDEWEDLYLPIDREDRNEMGVPLPPLVMDFPLITRRIAAQRSRFIAFGTDPGWLSEEFKKPDSTIKAVAIAADSRPKIRQELRDCGTHSSKLAV